MKSIVQAICIFSISMTTSSFADCVVGAKMKTSFTLLDSHTLLLQGGPGPDIIIKTFSFIFKTSTIKILKDHFCSYESAVLYIDDEVVDVNEVTKVE